jgi:voltage-gated potassium channel
MHLSSVRVTAWTVFVDVITILWLAVFVIGLITANESIADRCDLISLLLLPVFVIDLYFLFKQADNFLGFVIKRWFDIILVIPYFRIFRILKFARLLRALKIIKMNRVLGFMRTTKKSQRVVELVKRTDDRLFKKDVEDDSNAN